MARKVEFVTSYFELVHGRAPRGRGWWAFSTTRDGEVDFAATGTYAEAKKAARAWASERGVDMLWVLG